MQETLQKHTATENNALVYDTCYFILSSGPEQLYIIFFSNSCQLFTWQISMHFMFVFATLEDSWQPLFYHGAYARGKIWRELLDATILHIGNQGDIQTNLNWHTRNHRIPHKYPTMLTLEVISKHWIIQMGDLIISTQTLPLTVSQRYRFYGNSFLGTLDWSLPREHRAN